MKTSIARMVARRMITIAGSIALALTLVGGAYALTGDVAAPEPAADPTSGVSEPATSDGESAAGGDESGADAQRIHDGCEGADALEGDWNHGNYVSAFAKTGDHDAVKAAAHSDCGKKARTHGDESEAKGKGKGKAKTKDKPAGDDAEDDEAESESQA